MFEKVYAAVKTTECRQKLSDIARNTATALVVMIGVDRDTHTHLGVDFKLLETPLQQLLLSCRHLDKVGGMESETLVICTRQLTGKRQLISNGGKVWQVLQVIESAPGKNVACHPARTPSSISVVVWVLTMVPSCLHALMLNKSIVEFNLMWPL